MLIPLEVLKACCASMSRGRYDLTLRSRKPDARKFCKWITSEVLPTLRKTGTFTALPEQPQEEVPPALEIVEAEWELVPHELEGTSVAMRATDGYVTAMCRAAGKQFSDFARLDTTEAYLNELSSIRGIPLMELTLIKQGGRPQEQGTWIHPVAAQALAMWCSPAFHAQVTLWFREWRVSDPTVPVRIDRPTGFSVIDPPLSGWRNPSRREHRCTIPATRQCRE